MKQFLVNLLIAVALGLCGLCTYQWYRESRLRAEVEAQSLGLFKRKEENVNLDAALKRSEAHVIELDKTRMELNAVIKTNTLMIADLSKRLEASEKEADKLKDAVETYKNALDAANDNVLKANDQIRQQNETLKRLVEERDGIVEKYKGVVKQYEDLVKQFENYQAEAKKVIDSLQAPKKN